MELLTGVGTVGATYACSAAELNDVRSVRGRLGIGFATELADPDELGVERATGVTAARRELAERHRATVERELEECPAGHAQAVAEPDDGEAFKSAGLFIATSEGVGERASDAEHVAGFLDRMEERRLVRRRRFELPNSAHGASYIRVMPPRNGPLAGASGRRVTSGTQRTPADHSGQNGLTSVTCFTSLASRSAVLHDALGGDRPPR